MATRRGTRVIPQGEESEGTEDAVEQTAMEASTAASQVQTRNRVKRNSQSEENVNIERDMESNVSSDTPELPKLGVQILTRSRRKSGQSDGDVSEADSTASSHSTRRSRSRQTVGHLSESARILRSLGSCLVSEPIMESREDGELSEVESICSSVSTRASKRQSSVASKSTLRRSHRSVGLAPVISTKDEEDVSEVESNCSSVSGVQRARRTPNVRNRRITAKGTRSPVKESEVIEISDAESCSSGISYRPIAMRASRRNQGKSQHNDKGENSKEAKSGAVQDAACNSPVRAENSSSEALPTLSSPSRRSLRIRQIHAEFSEASVKEDSAAGVSVVHLAVATPSSNSGSPAALNKDVSGQIDLAGEPELDVMDVEEQPAASVRSNKGTNPILIDDDDISSDGHAGSEERADEGNVDGSNTVLSKGSRPHDGDFNLLLDSDASSESEQSSVEDDDDEEVVEGERDHGKPFTENVLRRTKPARSGDFMQDGLFVIDTEPGLDSSKKYYVDQKDRDDDAEHEDGSGDEEEPENADESEEEFIDEDEDDVLLNRPNKALSLSTSIDTGLKLKDIGGLYISFDAAKPNPGPSFLQKMKKGHKKADELLKNSVITPDFEKKECVPSHKELLQQLKKQRKEERDKSSGRGWFDMKAPELTDELKNDLKALKMRSAMDPKRFYKKNDRDGFPKYFQVGTVVDSSIDFYHSRIPKKERKRTLVEELLADAEFRRYNKKKFQEIMSEKRAQSEGKKNRKKKKFRK